MRPPRPASILLALLLSGTAAVVRGQVDVPASRLQEAMAAYLTDPAGNATAFLEVAREQGGTLDPMQALFLGDAALRVGQNRAAEEWFALARASGANPGFAGAAEIGLAWAALGRGRLREAYEHFDDAATTSPELRPFADVAMAFVGAAAGIPEARRALADAAARPDIDPAFREVAPLLDAYGRYWSGDVAGAADAFTAFAVAAPDSRFADDALYGAAQAKRRLGLEAEAQEDLEALAGDDHSRGRLSSRLVRLDGRALVREGMRRDRGLGTRVLSQRVADILDGDGGRLARASLAAGEARDGAGDPGAGSRPGARGRLADASDRQQPDAAHTSDSWRAGAETAHADGSRHAPAAERALRPRAARFLWPMGVALAIGLLLLAYWLFGRGRPQSPRSR